MASVSHKPEPATPRQAARRKSPVDRLLDPELFKALSDPTRLLLLRCLLKCRRACSVSEVAECCEVDFSVVARHWACSHGRACWRPARTAARYGTRPAVTRLADRFLELSSEFRTLAPESGCCEKGCC